MFSGHFLSVIYKNGCKICLSEKVNSTRKLKFHTED